MRIVSPLLPSEDREVVGCFAYFFLCGGPKSVDTLRAQLLIALLSKNARLTKPQKRVMSLSIYHRAYTRRRAPASSKQNLQVD
jgi:hypothetical protein